VREPEAGAKTADLARKHGVLEAMLYNWKAKYGGMDVPEAKRLKQLEDGLTGERRDGVVIQQERRDYVARIRMGTPRAWQRLIDAERQSGVIERASCRPKTRQPIPTHVAMGPPSPFAHAPLEVFGIVVHLLERKSQCEEAFCHVAGKRSRDTVSG